MARIIDYEQDEERPFGVGRFRLDDGSEYYLDDPERARKALEELYGPSDTLGPAVARETDAILREPVLSNEERYDNAVGRLALGPNAPQIMPRERFTRPDPLRGAVAGPGGGDGMRDAAFRTGRDSPGHVRDAGFRQGRDDPGEMIPLDARGDELSAEMDRAVAEAPPARRGDDDEEPEPPKAGQDQGPPLSEEELRRQQEALDTQALLGAVDPYKRSAGVDPRRMQRESLPVDKTYSRKGGVPLDVYRQQAAERAAAHGASQDLITRQQAEDAAAAQIKIEGLRAEGFAMKQANDRQQLIIQRKQEKYQADRAWLEKESDNYYDLHKPDPDGGLRKARGPIGNIASAIAQFMGAYAAIISGSPNFANQILTRKINEHVDAQIESFKRGKMKLDSQLARMAERGMSIEQMRSALKLQQEIALKKEIDARALEEGTRESMQAAESLKAGRHQEFVKAEHDYQLKALGEETVSGEMVMPQAGGRVAKTPLEIYEEASRLKGAVNKLGHEMRGGDYAERERERAAKAGEAQSKNARSDEIAYGKEMQTLGPAVQAMEGRLRELAEIKKKAGGYPGIGYDLNSPKLPLGGARQEAGTALGFESSEQAGRVRQLADEMIADVAAAMPGPESNQDIENIKRTLFGPNATEAQFEAGIRQLGQMLKRHQAQLDATYPEAARTHQERVRRARLAQEKDRQEQERRRQQGTPF